MTSKWVILAQYNFNFFSFMIHDLFIFNVTMGKMSDFQQQSANRNQQRAYGFQRGHKPSTLRIDLNIRSHDSCSANFCHHDFCQVMLLFGQPLFFLLTPMFLPKNTLSEYTIRSDSLTLWLQAKTYSPIYPAQQSQVRKYQVEQIWMASHVCMIPPDFLCIYTPRER